MTVNVSMKKLVIVLVLIVTVCGSIWWYMSAAPQRKVKAEIKLMVDYAQRQALEIVIIEQSVKLTAYKRQVAAAAKKQVPIPIVPAPPNPVVPDPNSQPKETK